MNTDPTPTDFAVCPDFRVGLHDFSVRAFTAIIRRNLLLLLLAPLVTFGLGFAIASFLPKWYTSVAFLTLDEAGARSADSLMRSPRVLDRVVSELGDQGTREANKRSFDRNRRIVVATGELSGTSRLYRLEYSDREPHRAQKINSAFIEAWLETTKPTPQQRSKIEAELDRRETSLRTVSTLIERVQKEATSLVSTDQSVELATSIANLIQRSDDNFTAILGLRNSLNGVPPDVVFSAPDLPEEPSWPKIGVISIISGFAGGLLALIFVIFRAATKANRGV
ncbi:hypothetical protein ACFQX9_38010 [Bradyrhizobium sp. GCM10028915]|uniref:hypothetical protein n=1 Tax=Bradyrhizobium sp. GCM10028915 TaxID=3273385 RepID=UPI00361A05C8